MPGSRRLGAVDERLRRGVRGNPHPLIRHCTQKTSRRSPVPLPAILSCPPSIAQCRGRWYRRRDKAVARRAAWVFAGCRGHARAAHHRRRRRSLLCAQPFGFARKGKNAGRGLSGASHRPHQQASAMFHRSRRAEPTSATVRDADASCCSGAERRTACQRDGHFTAAPTVGAKHVSAGAGAAPADRLINRPAMSAFEQTGN
jgi:hypothetical protein